MVARQPDDDTLQNYILKWIPKNVIKNLIFFVHKNSCDSFDA